MRELPKPLIYEALKGTADQKIIFNILIFDILIFDITTSIDLSSVPEIPMIRVTHNIFAAVMHS